MHFEQSQNTILFEYDVKPKIKHTFAENGDFQKQKYYVCGMKIATWS